MSTRWYEILFRFEVLHSFYSSGFSRDVFIKPTPATSNKIAGYRHLLRSKNEMPHLLFEATDENRTPLLPISGDTNLVFTVELTNPYFPNFTALPAKDADQLFLYDNLGGNPLQQKLVRLRPQVFAFSFSTSRVHADLEISDRNGQIVFSDSLHSSSKKFSANLKLYGLEGLYQFKVTTTQGAEVDEQIYISNQLYRRKPWAIVEILQQGAVEFDYSTENVYQLEFAASEKPWHFHLNLTRDYQNASFSIEDTESYNSPKEHPYTKMDFAETSGSQTYQKGQRVSFVSGSKSGNSINEQLVPYYQDPKTELQLKILKNGDETTVKPLPNPSALSPTRDVHLNI